MSDEDELVGIDVNVIGQPTIHVTSNSLDPDTDNAFYIALAGELDCLFLTADMKLYEKVKQLEFVRELKGI